MASALTQRRLLDAAGGTYSAQAGFALRDKPAALFQLLPLAIVLAKPNSPDLGVEACRQLRRAGMSTPARLAGATWQQRVDALGRAHYRRYDESTATTLGEAAAFVIDRYRGDLRRLAAESQPHAEEAAGLLEQIPGIGPTGASIYLREVQAVWPWLRPYLDEHVLEGARRLGIPHSPAGLRRWLGRGDPSEAVAALVRVSLDDRLAATVTARWVEH